MGSAGRWLAVWAAVTVTAGALPLPVAGETAVAPATKPAPAKGTAPASTKSAAPATPRAPVAPPKAATAKPAARPQAAPTTTPEPARPAATQPAASSRPGTGAPSSASKASMADPKPAEAVPKPAALPPQQVTPLRETPPSAAPLPGAPAPVAVAGSSFRTDHPVLGGFLTGLLGVGLANALLGEEGPGAPEGNLLEPVAASHTTAEQAGQVARLALVGALVFLAVVAWRRRSAANPPDGGAARQGRRTPVLSSIGSVEVDEAEPVLGAPLRTATPRPPTDEQDFADILLVVQAAWSEGNVMSMRAHVTPDMALWFDQRLAQNSDNGVENRVVDVSDIRVERLEDWEEAGLEFARARMRWRAIDYVIDMAKLPDEPAYVVDGSPEEPVAREEVWTFVKSPDGAWVLCEIEQDA